MPDQSVPSKTLLQSMGQQMANHKESKDLQNAESNADGEKAMWVAGAEILFVLLPFLVIAIILSYKRALFSIFLLPEWSIVSAVINGQSLVKFVSATTGRNGAHERVVFAVAALLVLLLVPSLVILSIVLSVEHVTFPLAMTQCVMFIVSLVIFSLSSFIEDCFKR